MSGRQRPAAKDGGRKRRASSASSEVAAPPSVSGPIVVPNTTWTPADPGAYGGRPASIDHLRQLELEDKSDNGRWSAFDVVPTTADNILDYIPRQQPLAAP